MKRMTALFLCILLTTTLAGCSTLETEGIDLALEDEIYAASQPDATEVVGSDKTAYNYLTGEYTLAQDRVGYRPYCVSINNISACWPQYGIAQADMMIEIETEGGITRMMAIYADARGVEKIGSVRSLRDQFIEATYPLDPIIVHIGTSIYADRAIAENNIRTLDGNMVPRVYTTDQVRMQSYSSEHCKFTSYDLITKMVKEVDIDPMSNSSYASYFNFAKPGEPVTLSGGAAEQVTFQFSSNTYDGDFRYDSTTGTYLKFQRNQKQMDAGINAQLAFENVLVLFANIETVEFKAGLVKVDYVSGGTGYYFSQGRYEEFHWVKDDYGSLFEFTKADGTPLVMNPGKTCLCVTRASLSSTFKIA